MPTSRHRILLVCLLLFSLVARGAAQQQKLDAHTGPLYRELATIDSLLFRAFNTRDLEGMKKYFSNSLEVYQDNTGFRSYEETVTSFKELFTKDYVLTRELVPGSMEVYPIQGFGAIQTGLHTFSHMEDGKMVRGTFKFLHVWEKTSEGWKIKRLITYDH